MALGTRTMTEAAAATPMGRWTRKTARHPSWGPVTVDADSRILQINGAPPLAPPAGPLPTPCMFAGIHVLEPEILDAIPPGPGSIIDVYLRLLGKGLVLRGWRMNGYWSDIGTRERYEQAERDVAEGRLAIS